MKVKKTIETEIKICDICETESFHTFECAECGKDFCGLCIGEIIYQKKICRACYDSVDGETAKSHIQKIRKELESKEVELIQHYFKRE